MPFLCRVALSECFPVFIRGFVVLVWLRGRAVVQVGQCPAVTIISTYQKEKTRYPQCYLYEGSFS